MKSQNPIITLGIDVKTKDVRKLILRLKKLVTTLNIADGGLYREDVSYSKVILLTTMTEEQLENWLYTVKHGANYIGIFVLKSEFCKGTQT